jgi:hypothetical protein
VNGKFDARAPPSHENGSQHDPEIANFKPPSGHTEKENILKPQNPINAILDTLASQQQHGETSLIVTIEPDLIQNAMNALQDYRKLFAPVIPGLTDTEPIYAIYERMRQADMTQPTILLFVECQTMEEFREALGRLPNRKSAEWRSLDNADYWERYFRDENDSKVL